MYRRGEGLQQDSGEAVQWYRKAAEQGDPMAESALGYAYLNGKGVPQDAAEGAIWYRKAAEQGYSLAQQAVGYLYATGQGVQQDDAQALVWYRKAAEQGDAESQQSLGYMYAYGRGVPKDRFEAVRWYRKAAKQGNAQALHMLGLLKSGSSATRKAEYFWVLSLPVGVWFSLDFLIPKRKRLNLRQTAVTLLGLVFLSGAALSLYALAHDDMQYSRWDITFRIARGVLALLALLVGIVVILPPKKRQLT
jgi:TPR repeat protein